MMPSSVVCTCSSKLGPSRAPRPCSASHSRTRFASAIPHGAFTRPPNGAWITTRTRVHLVAELLDDEHALVGHGAGRGALLMHVVDERRVVALVGAVARRRARASCSSVRTASSSRRSSPIARREVRRARRVLAVPEGHSRRRARRRRHDHAIVLDGVDAPRRRAELKDVADARSRARTLRRARRVACGRGD